MTRVKQENLVEPTNPIDYTMQQEPLMSDILFSLDDIKFGTDKPTLERAFGLYQKGKVTRVESGECVWQATVIGTKPYQVSVNTNQYDMAHCSCYLGQRDMFCKHMVALGIYMVKNGETLTEDDTTIIHEPTCSGKRGQLTDQELPAVKNEITALLRYIKPYQGPSRIWFAYQSSLCEGCHRLAKVVSELPVSLQTARLLVNLLIRLDRKLVSSGVDDSDGTVGGFIEQGVTVLEKFIEIDAECVIAFTKLENRETCFGWEEPLLALVE